MIGPKKADNVTTIFDCCQFEGAVRVESRKMMLDTSSSSFDASPSWHITVHDIRITGDHVAMATVIKIAIMKFRGRAFLR